MVSSGAGGSGANRNCVSCGRAIAWDASVCPYCGHDYRAQMYGQQQVKKESAMPMVGGILILIAGLIEIAGGAVVIGGGAFFVSLDFGGAIAIACGALVVLLGVIALIGGVFAIQRKHFGLAILGAILGLGGWFIPGLIGLILIAVSRDEFRD